jgi:tetratricopeptide (TPR) repeat protein
LFFGGTFVAKQRLPRTTPISSTPLSPQDAFQVQLQSLLKQQKYRQALEEIAKARRSQPDLSFSPSEAEIWLLRGKQEFQKANFKQADTSLRRALQLGLGGEPHYWLAKSLLAINRLEDAIALLRTAFENGSLPKDYSICYAKLLLLKGDIATVEQLLHQQKKRFPAAQQHWLRGVLALKAQKPDVALESFQKLKRPVTPSDRLDIWLIYSHQLLGNWETAALKLEIEGKPSIWGFSFASPKYTEHPLLQRLALLQQAKTGHPSLQQMRFRAEDAALHADILSVLSVMERLDENNPHEAGHALLKIDRRSNRFPELSILRPALLTLAGQQAFDQGETECAQLFWEPLLTEQPFNPQLAVNLLDALDTEGAYSEEQRLLTRLIKWLEKEAKQHPDQWNPEKLSLTLASAHCRLADTSMALGRSRAAIGSLQQAERLSPQSPDVLGRKGLVASLEERYEEATQLLTQAIEGGCRHLEVYIILIKTWKKLGKPEEALEARRRFGKYFDDVSSETEVEELPWVTALSTGLYPVFSRLVQLGSKTDPALRACQIFVDAVQGEPNSGGRVSLNQPHAVELWDTLLQGLSPKEQVPTLQAIALSIQLFAKREKGIAALITRYMLKLAELGTEQPEAREAHLVILAIKERDPKKLQAPLQSYCNALPQPGHALAQLQFKLRRFNQDPLQKRILSTFIEDALRREPQNPLLLLAKATTYLDNSPSYEDLKQQGFDIARRLQDAKALQAFRDEQAFLNNQAVQRILPSSGNFDPNSMTDMDDFLEIMIRKLFGSKIPAAELNQMLPELKQMMLENMPSMDDEEMDEDPIFGSEFLPTGFSSGSGRSQTRNRKFRN